ncbi:MAG: hypothetical protein VB118_04670 [Oscillospiraceae bacterium]|nr:hypothetical protein [Oscillospiraceae bacterium]
MNKRKAGVLSPTFPPQFIIYSTDRIKNVDKITNLVSVSILEASIYYHDNNMRGMTLQENESKRETMNESKLYELKLEKLIKENFNEDDFETKSELQEPVNIDQAITDIKQFAEICRLYEREKS